MKRSRSLVYGDLVPVCEVVADERRVVSAWFVAVEVLDVFVIAILEGWYRLSCVWWDIGRDISAAA